MGLKTIQPDDLYNLLEEVSLPDHLVLLEFRFPNYGHMRKLLRFQARETLLDFLAYDLPLVLATDHDLPQALYREDSDTGPFPFAALRDVVEIWYDESNSPELEGLIGKSIEVLIQARGIDQPNKAVQASLEWVGQPWDLPMANVPFLHDIRNGIFLETGFPPTQKNILHFLMAYEKVSHFYRDMLINWDIIPMEMYFNVQRKELEAYRSMLQSFWDCVKDQDSPTLAAMWRGTYDRLYSLVQS